METLTDSQLFGLLGLYVDTMFILSIFLIVVISGQSYINYKLRKKCHNLQEQIYSAHRKFDHKFTLLNS